MSENVFSKSTEALSVCAPYLLDTIKRYFEMQLHSQSKRFRGQILESLIHKTSDSNYMELSDVKLISFPKFQISELNLNSSILCMNLSVNAGDLLIDANYDTASANVSGKLRINIENVQANGEIGLLISGDSFMSQNYDLKYEIGNVSIETNNEEVAALAKSIIQAEFSNRFSPFITDLFNMCFGESVVEQSVCERFEDETYVENLRAHFSSKANKAIAIADPSLKNLQTYFETKQSLETNPLEIKFPFQNGMETCKISGGNLKDFKSIRHKNDLSSYKNAKDDTQIVFGSLHVDFVKLTGFDMELSLRGTDFKTAITVDVRNVTVFIKLSVNGTNGETVIDDLRIMEIRNLEIEVHEWTNNFTQEYLEFLQPKVDIWVKEYIWAGFQKRLDEFAKM